MRDLPPTLGTNQSVAGYPQGPANSSPSSTVDTARLNSNSTASVSSSLPPRPPIQPEVLQPLPPVRTPVTTVYLPPRVTFFDAFKFNGAAPETINSRLAMVGFLQGAMRELRTGETLLVQAQHLPVPTVLLLALIVYASLVPIFKGAKMEAFGWFTPKAEATNGRAAMLAFAVVLALEYKSGVCFF